MGFRDFGKKLTAYLGKNVDRAITRAVEHARGYVTGGTMFEEMGFYYIGPIDGHNLDHLLPVLKNIRDSDELGPVLVHVVTEKGHGYLSAEQADDKWHSVAKFDVVTGAQAKSTSKAPSYTTVFAKSLIKEAEKDDRIIAITAAMPSGTGLNLFGDRLTDRTIFGWEMPASVLQSVNPLLIIIFAPVFAWLWLALGRRHREADACRGCPRPRIRGSPRRADGAAPCPAW